MSVDQSEWVEFASREWCVEANRYLQEQAAQHPEALAGVEWSVTERWRDAPAHLGWPDDVAGFWFRIADGAIKVGEGPAESADTAIDGVYNAILPIGWTIYNGDAQVQARAAREYGYLSRANPVQMNGKPFPEHPPLMPFLGGLHDHMARRTVNNPHVEHRMESYGLQSNVEELTASGKTVLKDAFTSKLASQLRESGSDDLWWEMAVHPWVLTLVDAVLGPEVVLVEESGDGALTAEWRIEGDDAGSIVVVSTGAPGDLRGSPHSHYAASQSVAGRSAIGIGNVEAEQHPPVLLALLGS